MKIKSRNMTFAAALFALLQLTASCASEKNDEHDLTFESFNQCIWNIADNNDEFVYLSKKPSIVLFYDENSEPCKSIMPIADSLSSKYGQTIDFYKTNVATEQALCNSLKISVTPTIILFSNDSKPLVVEGLRPQREYENIIEKRISKE